MADPFRDIPTPAITIRRSRLDLFKLQDLQPAEPDFGSDDFRVLVDVPCLFVDPKTSWVWLRCALTCPGDASQPGGVSVRPAAPIDPTVVSAIVALYPQVPVPPGGDPAEGAVALYWCASLSPYTGYSRLWRGDEDVRVCTQADFGFIL